MVADNEWEFNVGRCREFSVDNRNVVGNENVVVDNGNFDDRECSVDGILYFNRIYY